MNPQYLCVKKPLNDRKNTTFPVFTAKFERNNITAKLRYNLQQETKQFYYLFILLKYIAANWQLVTLLFRKSRRKNKSLICEPCKSVAKGKTLVTNATVLVAISSPALRIENNCGSIVQGFKY